MKKLVTTLLFALIAVTCVSAQGGVNSENHCAPNSEQRNVAVHFDVPEFIETGLSDGSMERVGGIIRHADNQQTIAWLRKGGQVGQVAQTGANLLEDVTRLTGYGSLALGQLLASVTPILNVSMAGYALIEHIASIRAHEAEIERIFDRVAEEFQRDREVELLSALHFAENSLTARSEAYKHEAVVNVTYELTIARAQLLRDLNELLHAEMNKDNAKLAMNYQILAMKICAMSARLRLEIGEDATALDGLSQCVAEHNDYAEKFIRKWLGGSPALYFHESVSDDYMDSFLSIQRWLLGKRDVLREIIDQHRRSFWDKTAIAPLYTRVGLNDRLIEDPFYREALPNAELLIENFQRLQGYELELASMCSPTFAQWEAFDGDDGKRISQHAGYVMLVDASQLASG